MTNDEKALLARVDERVNMLTSTMERQCRVLEKMQDNFADVYITRKEVEPILNAYRRITNTFIAAVAGGLLWLVTKVNPF